MGTTLVAVGVNVFLNLSQLYFYIFLELALSYGILRILHTVIASARIRNCQIVKNMVNANRIDT